MKEKNNLTASLSNIAIWAFMLCLAWFGHFNNWWPAAFPIVFTVIICTLYGIALIAAIVLIILSYH